MLLKSKNKIDNQSKYQTPTTTRLRIKLNPQDTQEHHGESIQGFGKELSEIEGNMSKLQTKVQGNTERDSEVSKNIEVIQKSMGKSSDRITSNTNAVEALKVGWYIKLLLKLKNKIDKQCSTKHLLLLD